METIMRPTWKPLPGTAEYQWEGWVARYQRTIKGYASYAVHRPDGSIYGHGGLPTMLKP